MIFLIWQIFIPFFDLRAIDMQYVFLDCFFHFIIFSFVIFIVILLNYQIQLSNTKLIAWHAHILYSYLRIQITNIKRNVNFFYLIIFIYIFNKIIKSDIIF